MEYSEESEAKSIHGLHAMVYKYLMLGVLTNEDIIDNEQTNEVARLNKIK
jgi:hypothetical protein